MSAKKNDRIHHHGQQRQPYQACNYVCCSVLFCAAMCSHTHTEYIWKVGAIIFFACIQSLYLFAHSKIEFRLVGLAFGERSKNRGRISSWCWFFFHRSSTNIILQRNIVNQSIAIANQIVKKVYQKRRSSSFSNFVRSRKVFFSLSRKLWLDIFNILDEYFAYFHRLFNLPSISAIDLWFPVIPSANLVHDIHKMRVVKIHSTTIQRCQIVICTPKSTRFPRSRQNPNKKQCQ